MTWLSNRQVCNRSELVQMFAEILVIRSARNIYTNIIGRHAKARKHELYKLIWRCWYIESDIQNLQRPKRTTKVKQLPCFRPYALNNNLADVRGKMRVRSERNIEEFVQLGWETKMDGVEVQGCTYSVESLRHEAEGASQM